MLAKAVVLTHIDGAAETCESSSTDHHRRKSSTSSIRIVVTEQRTSPKLKPASSSTLMAGPNIVVTPAEPSPHSSDGAYTPTSSSQSTSPNVIANGVGADKLIVGVDFGTTYSGYVGSV